KCTLPSVHAATDAVLLKALETRHHIQFDEALRPLVTRFARLNAVLRDRCRLSKCVYMTLPIP
ncbi:hypothetical protein KIPB_013806, partial [Kipferlia bialata]